MKYIIFVQTPHDRVRYVSDEMPEPNSMTYKKFVPFLFENFFIVNRKALIDSLDSFQTILLDTESGEWKEQNTSHIDITKYSFADLWELNKEKIEAEAQKQNRFQNDFSPLRRIKQEISKRWNDRKRGAKILD